MATYTLVIGNKNYSSWSLRPWLALRVAEIAFEELIIPLDEPTTREEILKHTGSGRVPVLKSGDLRVWDSLAICEYLAETHPDVGLWPAAPAALAVARAVSAEMHAGFTALRAAMPMNIRSRFPGRGRGPGVQDDINRITAIWRRCRERFGAGGAFLFGDFTIADAMFAPVVARFVTYEVEVGADEAAYMAAIGALPAMRDWAAAAEREPWIIDSAEF
ncbi:MAG: glutathione S-transferase family protein [Pseudomonadota bacterium]|nr:glutathione S-transferase family protein [Pseudomonadota bacterium]